MKSFCLRGYGRILWREATEQTTFCIGIFAMLVVMQASLTTMESFDMIQPRTVAFCFNMALFMTAIYAAASSALLFTAEIDAGTFVFQRTKPIGWLTYLSGKLSWTVLSSFVLGLAAWIETSVWQGVFPNPRDASLALGVCGVGILEGIAWGLIATIAIRGPLRAVITGIAMASLAAWVTVVFHHSAVGDGAVSVTSAYHHAAWTRVIVGAVVLASGVILARVWYRTGRPVGRGLLPRLLRGETDAVTLPGQWDSLGQPCRGRWIRLLWQAWRQVRSPAVVYWACCLAALTWAGLYYLSKRDHTSAPNEMALHCTAWAAFAILGFSSLLAGYTFGADQKARFLQLARDGVSPWEIWLSRVAVMAAVFLPPAIVVLAALWHTMGQMFEFPLLQPLSVTLVLLGYCSALVIGQACSMFVRSRIIALLAAPVTFGCFTFWIVLAVFWAGLDWKLGVAPPLLALLIGTRLLAGTRLRQDSSWRTMRAPALLVVVAVVFCYQAFAYYRVHQIRPYDSVLVNDDSLDPFSADRTWQNMKSMRVMSENAPPTRKFMELELGVREDYRSLRDYVPWNRYPFAQPWRLNSSAIFGTSRTQDVMTYSEMLAKEAELNETLRDVIAQLDSPNERLRDCIDFLEDWPQMRSRHSGWLLAAYWTDRLWLQHGPMDKQYATYGFHTEPLPAQYRWFSFERRRMLRLLDRAYRIAAERADEYEQAVINDQVGVRPVGAGLVTDLDIIPYEPDRPIWYQISNHTLFESAKEDGFRLMDSVAWMYWYWDDPFYRAEAQRRGTILYLALRMHYNEHGELSESLDALVSRGYLDQIPVIPVACEPFFYDPTGLESRRRLQVELARGLEYRPTEGTNADESSTVPYDYSTPFLWYPTQASDDIDPWSNPGSLIPLDFAEQQDQG